jgi:hypothetical protein
MSSPIPTAIILSMLAWHSMARADPSGQPSVQTTDPAMCDALAGMPNAPMTVASCKAMMQMGRDDPAAHRAGDETLTCDQIFAEMQATPGMGVSNAEASRTEQIIRDGETLTERHAAKASVALAPNVAAVSALGVVGTVLPNAALAPAMAAQQADLVAKNKVAAADYLKDVHQLTTDSTEMMESRLGNPRVSRLSNLAMQKNCAPPEG